jgi:hypothetical protein
LDIIGYLWCFIGCGSLLFDINGVFLAAACTPSVSDDATTVSVVTLSPFQVVVVIIFGSSILSSTL